MKTAMKAKMTTGSKQQPRIDMVLYNSIVLLWLRRFMMLQSTIVPITPKPQMYPKWILPFQRGRGWGLGSFRIRNLRIIMFQRFIGGFRIILLIFGIFLWVYVIMLFLGILNLPALRDFLKLQRVIKGRSYPTNPRIPLSIS